MGISSSKSNSPGNDQVPRKKVELIDPSVDWPESGKEDVREFIRDLTVMFGDPKEEDREKRQKKTDEGFDEFMKRGACKEAYMAFHDCVDETGDLSKCRDRSAVFHKCMYSHLDYYQSYLVIVEAAQAKANKMLDDIIATERAKGNEIDRSMFPPYPNY